MNAHHLPRTVALLMSILLAACGRDQPAPSQVGGPSLPGGVSRAAIAAPPLILRGSDFPALASSPELPQMYVLASPDINFPTHCSQVRAATPDELVPQWRHALSRISLRCEASAADDSGRRMLSLWLSAPLKPHMAQLGGMSVLETRSELSEWSGSSIYVVDAPLPQALAALRPKIEERCRQDHANGGFQTDCVMHAEDGTWRVETGELNNATWLQADPGDSARTLYGESWAD